MLRVAGIVKESIVDGPGIRTVVFLQGCPRHCEGCHNPSTLPFEGGTEYTAQQLAEEVAGIMTPLHRGITLSGGDPLAQADGVLEFLHELKKLKPGVNVWCYTGYVYDEVKHLAVMHELNVLVDGPFILAQRDLDFPYRGSRNQRLIDVPASLDKGEAVEYEL